MHADDGFDRALQPSETHYFHCPVRCTIDAPAGDTSVWVQRGFSYLPWRQNVKLVAGADQRVAVRLQPNALPPSFGRFRSADLHVHMNYGGHYRPPPRDPPAPAPPHELHVGYKLIRNKQGRGPRTGHRRRPAPVGEGDPPINP